MIFDVFVVGAGPAGCSAAIIAAKSGLRVGLAEACEFPRDRPGEALDPDIGPLFRKLGVATEVSMAGFLRSPGWIHCVNGKRTAVPFSGPQGLRLGYQVWRAAFDSLLLGQAARFGVRIIQPARVRDFKAEHGRYSVRVNGQEVPFRHLVDASGSHSWLRRELGLPLRRVSEQLTTRFGYWTGQADVGVMEEFHQYACGWTWLARVKPDCVQFVRLSLDSSALPELPTPFSALRSRGADVTWRFVPHCAGDGYFFCGDAAAVLDPAATCRVRYAMAGAVRAAELIVRVERRLMNRSEAAAAYRKWSTAQFAAQVKRLVKLYSAFERPPAWLQNVESKLYEAESLAADSSDS